MYNYYKATWSVVTAKRAKLLGHPVRLAYGYYVLISPPVMDGGMRPGWESVHSWCRSKAIAQRCVVDCVNSQIKGYHGCPCGSNKQARGCCGIPKKED